MFRIQRYEQRIKLTKRGMKILMKVLINDSTVAGAAPTKISTTCVKSKSGFGNI